MVHLIQRINFRRGMYEELLELDVNLDDEYYPKISNKIFLADP